MREQLEGLRIVKQELVVLTRNARQPAAVPRLAQDYGRSSRRVARTLSKLEQFPKCQCDSCTFVNFASLKGGNVCKQLRQCGRMREGKNCTILQSMLCCHMVSAIGLENITPALREIFSGWSFASITYKILAKLILRRIPFRARSARPTTPAGCSAFRPREVEYAVERWALDGGPWLAESDAGASRGRHHSSPTTNCCTAYGGCRFLGSCIEQLVEHEAQQLPALRSHCFFPVLVAIGPARINSPHACCPGNTNLATWVALMYPARFCGDVQSGFCARLLSPPLCGLRPCCHLVSSLADGPFRHSMRCR